MNRRERISPLTWRILAVNALALAILGGSMLYLGRYEERLVQSEIETLRLEARLVASALGEGAVISDDEERSTLSPDLARPMVRRLVEASDTRTRLFMPSGMLLADSRNLRGGGGHVQIEDIPPPAAVGWLVAAWQRLAAAALDALPRARAYPIYSDVAAVQGPVTQAQRGETVAQVWHRADGQLLMTVAAPVQSYKQVLGAVLVSRSSAKIDATLGAMRTDLLGAFFLVLTLTVALSLYLARTIALPLRQLARAVRRVQRNQSQSNALDGGAAGLAQRIIPDLTDRGDEIGALSGALREMTAALTARLTAIDSFAADVAHELKNPLTSLRSAVETVARVQNPAQQQKLMSVIRDDVDRLDRLITDISRASRLDAELSRASAEWIDWTQLLTTVVDLYVPIDGASPRVTLVLPGDIVMVRGVASRLTQVVQNLVDNALSFSPPEGVVRLTLAVTGDEVWLTVDDDGPGVPADKLTAIFDRFYTERPRGEKFGLHSGLGLSIARQIVEAHRGRLWAENRLDTAGAVAGARFIVALPRV